MLEQRRKSKGKVPPVLASFYAQWRVRCGAVSVLHDDHDSPPERLLHSIWQHQRLVREQLNTLDGRPVRILHPGFLSAEGGSDFRGAIVQVGDGPPRTGNVEVDLRSSGWHAHGDDRNPAFAEKQQLGFPGKHHEIYLSDPRRVPPERLKTILRCNVTRCFVDGVTV